MMLRRILPRPLAIALLAYALGVGATYNGLLTPNIRWTTLALLGILLTVWLSMRWVFRWRGICSALDPGIALGALAIALSLITNSDDWRRITIGIWYLTAYALIWYLLHDLLGYGWMKRAQLADALLMAGGLIIGLGLLQSREWIGALTLTLQGQPVPPLPRPVSTLGNPNTLAAVLVMLIPLSAAYSLTSRGLSRFVALVYALAGLILLLLTYSRGGWIGTAAGLAILGLSWLSQGEVRAWWSRASLLLRGSIIGLGLGVLILSAGVTAILIRSLEEGGRGLNLRTFIFESAVRLFQEAPLTGTGLFTFGSGLARLNSTPPTEPHSHAHNLVLHVAAELGIAGLVALAVITILAVAAALRLRRGLQPVNAIEERDRIAQIGGCAAAVGAAVHHLLDLPAMNPAVALMILVVVVLATAPKPDSAVRTVMSQIGRPITVGLGIISMLLLTTGVWSTAVYDPYYRAVGLAAWFVDDPIRTEEARAVITQAADADPALPVFSTQVGLLSASIGDLHAAIGAYERVVELAPEYAVGWANLAALNDASGRPERAFAYWLEASTRADRDAWFAFQLGESAEALALNDEAYAAYARALSNDPDIQLLPSWPESDIRSAVPLPPLSDIGQMILSIVQHEEGAEERYESIVSSGADVLSRVLNGMLQAHAGQHEQAFAAVDAARALAALPGERAWVAIGDAILAQTVGDPAAAAVALGAAADALELTVNDVDADRLQNIHYIQFLTYALPRQMVPQMNYPSGGFVILHVLDMLTATFGGIG